MRSRFAEATGPEVLPEVDVARNGDGAPEPFRGDDGLEVVGTDLPDSGVKTKPETEAAPAIESTIPRKNARRRMIWMAVAAVILVVVVVAAVVGGVLGSRHHNSAASSRTSSAPSSPSSTPSSSSPSAVASNSSLAVTGWWETTSQYNIRLFYQGKDGQLRMTGYSSSNGKWSTVATYQTDPPLKPGSPLAASCYNSTFYFKNEVNSTSNYTQIDVFYQGIQGYINNWAIQEEVAPVRTTTDKKGTLSARALRAGMNTRLAAHWPSVVFQNGVNGLEEAYYSIHNRWAHNILNLSAVNHSALVEVPWWGSRTGSANFIYQRDDHTLFAEMRHNASIDAVADDPAPNVPIPAQAAIGAFAIPKTAGNLDSLMNFYVLWQNGTVIQMTKNDDNNGWQTSSTPDALGSPDDGTDIACLTATDYVVTPIQSKYDMARCYYMVDGKVREVKYDGSTWSVIGYVPLD
ncbi:hypothetical protein TGAMA5MH_06864 [Trichoderma gamsii]|uniref:Fucose-specific lectin n=1 Tax=Trichoderma gamsii TaxID=398673 RepID=A0A2K0T642_9HYPO|nr:hypothetical protein TGAMA5MH_06864 [Trichoderma gamsii]